MFLGAGLGYAASPSLPSTVPAASPLAHARQALFGVTGVRGRATPTACTVSDTTCGRESLPRQHWWATSGLVPEEEHGLRYPVRMAQWPVVGLLARRGRCRPMRQRRLPAAQTPRVFLAHDRSTALLATRKSAETVSFGWRRVEQPIFINNDTSTILRIIRLYKCGRRRRTTRIL